MTCKEAAEIGRAAGFPKYSAAAHSLSSNPAETGVMRVPALQRALQMALQRAPRGERRSQNELVLEYMQKHGSIDNDRARNELRVGRLASRIHELRQAGIPIVTIKREYTYPDGEKTSWGVYYLNENAAPGGGTPETAND